MSDLGQVVAAVEVATKILAHRALALLALLMVFGLFCWAMYLATPLHYAVAGTFGMIIFLPVLWGARANAGDKHG